MEHPNSGQSDSERGISPVVGTVLLIGVTLLLAASVFSFAAGFEIDGPPAIFASSGDVSFDIAGDEITDQQLVLTHHGGQAVPTEDVYIVLDVGEKRIRAPLSEITDGSGNSWTGGEQLSIGLSTNNVCTGAEEIELSLVQSTGSQSHILTEDTIPVTTPRFTISNGQVVPQHEYSVDLRLIGTAFTHGAHGPDIDIATEVVVGNETYNPWPGNVNDGRNPRTVTFTDQPPGAGISVKATGDPNSEYMTARTRSSTQTSDGWVYVLRDGDTPPVFQGYGDQANVAAYLAPYVNESGMISLASNEAIFLFELGNSQTGAAADYQDVVVLATLEPEVSRSSEYRQTNRTNGFVCPPAE